MPRPIIVAHRGLHHHFPENSHAAFRAAWMAGIVWCECDIRLGEMRRPYVLHDATLDRTTTAIGPLASVTWWQHRSIRLRDASGAITPEQVPTLHAIRACMPPGSCLLVEDKEPYPHHSLHVEMAGRQWMYQSFDRDAVERMTEKKRFGKIYRVSNALLVEANEIADATQCRCDAVHYPHEVVDAALVARTREAGKGVGAWTVNAEQDIRRVLALGVDMLITDEPVLAQAIADEGESAFVPSSGTPGEG